MKKISLSVVFVLILIIVSGLVSGYFLRSCSVSTGIQNKIMTAENAILNYEYFKDQEAHIDTCLKNEEIAFSEWDSFKKELPKSRSDWNDFERQEESSLRNSYYALQKLTNQAMNEYNANSKKVNRNIFKELPTNIFRSIESQFKLIKGD